VEKRVTSHDVAHAAGVSRATVSFILNNAPGQTIPQSTRDAVLKAARDLGYVPSAAASALRKGGASKLVLCLAPDWEPAAVMDEALNVLTRELRVRGYATLIAKSAEDPASLEPVWRTVSPAMVVAMFDLPASVRAQLKRMNVPLMELFFHSFGDRPAHDDVQVQAGRAQAAHLLARGASRIAYLLPEGLREPEVPLDRLRGVKEVCRTAQADALEVVAVQGFGAEARAPIRELLNRHRGERLGICAYNDALALAALAQANEAGLAVPDQVLIIGVDNDPFTEVVSPPLTSVRFDPDAHMSRIASEIADRLGLDPGQPSSAPLVQVVARAST
jgi:DNA-binding LacI/PurR family transcriptional regulator